MLRILKCWLPVVVWMAVIFQLSTDLGSAASTSRIIEPLLHWLFPNMSSGSIKEVHLFVRKGGHLCEYVVLALLLWRAMSKTRPGENGSPLWKTALLALVVCAAYAGTDEFHQSFVHTRGPSVRDVLIDTCGSLLGLSIVGVRTARRRKALDVG